MKACAHCGKEKYQPACYMKRKYCSLACRDAAARAKRLNEAEGIARCSRCKEWKPIAEFVKGRAGLPHSHCKPCNSKWFAERSTTPSEKRKTYRPAYKLSPEERAAKILERSRRGHLVRRAAGKAPPKYDLGRMMCEQDGKCAYCGELLSGPYHIDHKTPVSRGGTNDVSNLHLTCPRCNMKKGAMTHEEFLVSKRRRPYRQSGPMGKLP